VFFSIVKTSEEILSVVGGALTMCKILWGHFEKGNSHKKHFLKCLALIFFSFFCPLYSTSINGKYIFK